MEILSRIDQKPIVVEIQQNINYGIMLSGGLDSAVLLFLILEDAKLKNIELSLQPFSMIKHDQSYKYVKGIIDYYNDRFQLEIPKTILVGNPELHHSEQSTFATREVFQKHPNINFLFNAVNQNPPGDWGDPSWEFPNRVKQSPHPKIIMPFVDLYKTHIVDLIFQYDIEYITKLTHTCTELTAGRCMECFQCNERHWAFTELGKLDRGLL